MNYWVLLNCGRRFRLLFGHFSEYTFVNRPDTYEKYEWAHEEQEDAPEDDQSYDRHHLYGLDAKFLAFVLYKYV